MPEAVKIESSTSRNGLVCLNIAGGWHSLFYMLPFKFRTESQTRLRMTEKWRLEMIKSGAIILASGLAFVKAKTNQKDRKSGELVWLHLLSMNGTRKHKDNGKKEKKIETGAFACGSFRHPRVFSRFLCRQVKLQDTAIRVVSKCCRRTYTKWH